MKHRKPYHGKVGQGCKDNDQGRDDVIQTLGDGHRPREASEDHGSDEHNDKHNPGKYLVLSC